MKRVVLLVSLVHLLLAFTSSATTTPNQVSQVVRDIKGDIVRSDARYFVVSAIWGAGGGGVTRGPWPQADGEVCGSQVVQSPIDVYRGTSVYFKPKAAEQVEISESSDVNIEFYNDNPTSICNHSTVWKVEGFPGPDFPKFLSTNGVAGDPLQVASWFQIKESASGNFFYKLVFCPFGGFYCTDIGTDVVDGQRRLVLSLRGERTFNVTFIKDNNTGIKSII